MPTITVEIPAYTSIEICNIDLSDHLSELEVDVTADTLIQLVHDGEIEAEDILIEIDDSCIVEHIDAGNVEIPDQTLLKLIEGRDDLVKLGLSGDLTIEEQTQQLFDRLLPDGPEGPKDPASSKRAVRLLVRHLCQDSTFRGAITDALGEHYAKAPLESLVPEVVEAPSVAEAAN